MKKIKIGDKVKVILGKNKGQVGQVKSFKGQKITVEGLNIKKKHVKPSQTSEMGKIIKFEAPIDISNVMLCDENGIICKVGFSIQNDIKVRILKKTKKLLS